MRSWMPGIVSPLVVVLSFAAARPGPAAEPAREPASGSTAETAEARASPPRISCGCSRHRRAAWRKRCAAGTGTRRRRPSPPSRPS